MCNPVCTTPAVRADEKQDLRESLEAAIRRSITKDDESDKRQTLRQN